MTDQLRTAEAAIDNLKLGPDLFATVLQTTTNATHSHQVAVVVWTRPERFCPGCEQSRPGDTAADPACPVMLDPQFGRETQAWSQQHGCGAWWGPKWEWTSVGYYDTVESLTERLQRLAAELQEAVDAEDDALIAQLKEHLEADIAEAVRRIEEDGEDVEYIIGGSEVEPGVWINREGQWEAWDYNPRRGMQWDGDCIVIVRENSDPPRQEKDDPDPLADARRFISEAFTAINLLPVGEDNSLLAAAQAHLAKARRNLDTWEGGR